MHDLSVTWDNRHAALPVHAIFSRASLFPIDVIIEKPGPELGQALLNP